MPLPVSAGPSPLSLPPAPPADPVWENEEPIEGVTMTAARVAPADLAALVDAAADLADVLEVFARRPGGAPVAGRVDALRALAARVGVAL